MYDDRVVTALYDSARTPAPETRPVRLPGYRRTYVVRLLTGLTTVRYPVRPIELYIRSPPHIRFVRRPPRYWYCAACRAAAVRSAVCVTARPQAVALEHALLPLPSTYWLILETCLEARS